MSKYVLLKVDDDREADRLLLSLALFPHAPLINATDDVIHVEVVPGLDAGDEQHPVIPGDPHGLDLATAIGWSYQRGSELAAEWGAAS